MPIEIRELQIKATVGNQQQNSQTSTTAKGQTKTPCKEDCLDLIVETLKSRKER